MKRKGKLTIIVLFAMCILLLCGYKSIDKIKKQKTLNSKDVTLITKVLTYGEVGYAIACDFGSKVDSSNLSIDSFQIETLAGDKNEARTITKVYTNDAFEVSDSSKPGRYVIIELDYNDANAPTLTYDEKRDQNTRNDLKYFVTINKDIKTANGKTFKASKEKILNGSELTPVVEDFKKLSYEDSKDNKLNYSLFEPKGKSENKYPLVIFLHGSGERGDGNLTQLLSSKGAITFAEPEAQEKNPCYVLAPQAPYDVIPSSYWCQEPMSSLLFALIEETIKEHDIDTNRIYITGLSNGGDGVWNLVEKHPNFFAAAVPICGLSNSNYDITQFPAYSPVDPSSVEILKNIPLWVFHGADDPAVNVKNSREIVAAIKEAGGNLVNYTEYPEGTLKPVGHFAWTKAYESEDLMNWLFNQWKNNS